MRACMRACVHACVRIGIDAAEKKHVRRTCCGALDSWNSPEQANDRAAGWGSPASGSVNHAAQGFHDHGRGRGSRLGAGASASLATCAEGNASRPVPPEDRRHAHAPSQSSGATTCLQCPRRELSKVRLAAKLWSPRARHPRQMASTAEQRRSATQTARAHAWAGRGDDREERERERVQDRRRVEKRVPEGRVQQPAAMRTLSPGQEERWREHTHAKTRCCKGVRAYEHAQ